MHIKQLTSDADDDIMVYFRRIERLCGLLHHSMKKAMCKECGQRDDDAFLVLRDNVSMAMMGFVLVVAMSIITMFVTSRCSLLCRWCRSMLYINQHCRMRSSSPISLYVYFRNAQRKVLLVLISAGDRSVTANSIYIDWSFFIMSVLLLVLLPLFSRI
mmetsp:Transcript_53336/g.79263  ORF Transcript_53336/g.79263 Transcript_53336/m.79263 type:complete len:158 (-) Transcript_53336:689-1162(-)